MSDGALAYRLLQSSEVAMNRRRLETACQGLPEYKASNIHVIRPKQSVFGEVQKESSARQSGWFACISLILAKFLMFR